MQKGQGVADPDAPTDAASMRFWCFVGGKFTDRESTSLEMEATAAVSTSSEALGSLLGNQSDASSVPSLALTNGGSGSGPSLQELVNVMGNSGQATVAATPKAKVKAKAKAKARAGVDQQKTPKEIRDAIRTLQALMWLSKVLQNSAT